MSLQDIFFRYRWTGIGVFSGILLVTGIFTAMRLLPEEPQVRIGAAHKGTNLPDGFFVYQQLTAHGISIKSITPEQGMLVIRLNNEEQRIAAEKVLKQVLSDDYTTA